MPAISSKIADIPSDEFSWRKYGQKPIKGSPYPRYYSTLLISAAHRVEGFKVKHRSQCFFWSLLLMIFYLLFGLQRVLQV